MSQEIRVATELRTLVYRRLAFVPVSRVTLISLEGRDIFFNTDLSNGTEYSSEMVRKQIPLKVARRTSGSVVSGSLYR